MQHDRTVISEQVDVCPSPEIMRLLEFVNDDFEFTQQSPPVDYGPSRLEKPHEIVQGLPSFGGEGLAFRVTSADHRWAPTKRCPVARRSQDIDLSWCVPVHNFPSCCCCLPQASNALESVPCASGMPSPDDNSESCPIMTRHRK